MSERKKCSGEGRVTHLSHSPAKIELADGKLVDTMVTSLDIELGFNDRDKLAIVIYPHSTSIRPGDYIIANGLRAYDEGTNYSVFAEEILVLDRGLFRNKRHIKQDYSHPPFSVQSWHW